MGESGLVSCIVPVFNGERYLRKTLESILQQTYRPLEIIVIDDGSTDGSAAVVESYGERIIHFRQANSGPAAARNRGLCEARGEFIAFLDQDDLWHPEKLARQAARFKTRPELVLSLTYAQNFWVPELREEAARLRNHRYAQPQVGYLLQALLARRTLFDKVGYFDSRLPYGGGDDVDWFLRVAEQGVIAEVLPEVLTYRRLHRTNLSRALATAYQDWLPRVFKASLDRRRLNGTPPPPATGLPRERESWTGPPQNNPGQK